MGEELQCSKCRNFIMNLPPAFQKALQELDPEQQHAVLAGLCSECDNHVSVSGSDEEEGEKEESRLFSVVRVRK